MLDPSKLDDKDNWLGGFYELAIEVGPTHDGRLEKTLAALWRIAAIHGCFTDARGRSRPVAVPVSLSSLETAGGLSGLVTLPGNRVSVCGVLTMREEEAGVGHSDWLVLYIPLSALARIDSRVGGFPFGADSGAASLSWRRPLDTWLADVGTRIYTEVPFELALVGFESMAELHAHDLRGGVPKIRMHGVLVPINGKVRYYEATS